MKIRNLASAGLAVAFGAITMAARANDVILTQTAYYYADGGEFTAWTSPDNFAQFYAPSATIASGNQVGFQTFCVEASVYFWPNVDYSYTLSQTDSRGVNLTEGAAYLYAKFAEGVLPGYDYTDAGQRTTDAGLLQSALWNLQGGQSLGWFPSGGAGNPYYDLASSTLGANLLADNNNTYGVSILELWDSNHNTYQNQLVFTDPPSAPDGGSTWVLLAVGVAGLIPFSRHFNAPKLAAQRSSHRRQN